MWPTFGKSKFLWAIFESLMIAFEQDAMDLSLEHTKEQYTWIWRLNVKYLCGQCFMWTTFGKSKFLWAIFESLMIAVEQDAMDPLLEHTKEQHTWIWWLNVKFLLGQWCMWTILGKSKFLWAIFECVMIALEQEAMDLSLGHTKAQHIWIWGLNVNYLHGQWFMWTTFGKLKFLWAIFESFMIALEKKNMDRSLEYTKAQHTWLWLLNVKYLLGCWL